MIETKIEDVADNLHRRIQKEVGKIIKSQMAILGVEINSLKDATNAGIMVTNYNADDRALETYRYRGRLILGVRISENSMAIEFDIPDLLTMERYEGEIAVESGEAVVQQGAYKYSYEMLSPKPLAEGEEVPISKYLIRENIETGEKERRALYSNGLRPPGPWEKLETQTQKGEVQDV